MRAILILAAVAAGAATCAVAEPAPAPTPPASDKAVLSYPAEYYAPMGVATALEMVQRTPGFAFDNGAAMRGFGAAGNVLLDGERPLTKTEALDEILKRIPAASVLRIEVIRGGAPGIDMQGRTVLANIVRRSTASTTGAVQASAFQLWDGRTLPGVRAEFQRRWNGKLLEGSMVYGQGPDDGAGDGTRIRTSASGATLIQADVHAFGSGWREWFTGAFETPLWTGRLRLSGVVQINPLRDDFVDTFTTPAGGVETEYDRIKRKTAEFGVRYTGRLGAATSVELLGLETLGVNSPNVEFTGPGVVRTFDLDRHTGETILRAVLRHRLSPVLSVEGGAEGDFNWLQSHTSLIVNGASVFLPAASVRVEEKRGELFGLATWQALPTLNVEAGIRVEASKITSSGDTNLEKTLVFPKPRVVATWSPDPLNQVRVRLEREVGQLNFDDFVAPISVGATGTPIAGNPDIEPQQAWVIEAAYERRFAGSGVIGVTLRRYWLSDVVDRIAVFGGTSFIDAPGNLGKGSREEAAAQLTLPLGRLGITGGLLKGQITLRRSEVTDQVTAAQREISGVRPIEWDLHFSQDLPRLRLNWGVDAFSRFRERYYRVTEIETREVRTYVTLYAEYKLRPTLLLRGEIQNLTARGVTRDRQVFAGPRGAAPLLYVDTRDLQPGQIFLVRLRKVFR